jgi:hypothetical protein
MSVTLLNKIPNATSDQPKAFSAEVATSKSIDMQSKSPRSSMRMMKAEETLALALRNEAPAPNILGEVDFSKLNPIDTNMTVRLGRGVFYNSRYGESWVMHYAGRSSIQAVMDIEKDPSKTYTLDLNHLSSLVNGQPLAKITILVNRQVLVSGHNPNNGGYIHEKFDITKFVKNGHNSMQITLDLDAHSDYWINHLSVLED